MRCEVVAVGTELLLGQIVDTNSAWMGEQLALAGIDRTHGQTGGRQPRPHRRRPASWRSAASDAVIVCGGLGPTQDDITRDAIARVMGVALVRGRSRGRAHLERCSRRGGGAMPANNLRQATVPEGATAIADPQPGTAPGLICPVGDKVDLRRARRALRAAGDRDRRHPARPAPGGRAPTRSSGQPHAAHVGRERVRAWPSGWPTTWSSSTPPAPAHPRWRSWPAASRA